MKIIRHKSKLHMKNLRRIAKIMESRKVLLRREMKGKALTHLW
jgi:hypothetical protein